MDTHASNSYGHVILGLKFHFLYFKQPNVSKICSFINLCIHPSPFRASGEISQHSPFRCRHVFFTFKHTQTVFRECWFGWHRSHQSVTGWRGSLFLFMYFHLISTTSYTLFFRLFTLSFLLFVTLYFNKNKKGYNQAIKI